MLDTEHTVPHGVIGKSLARRRGILFRAILNNVGSTDLDENMFTLMLSMAQALKKKRDARAQPGRADSRAM